MTQKNLNEDRPPDAEQDPENGHQEFPNQFCPVCSTRLESHRCKMICPRCGYFMSCSEFE